VFIVDIILDFSVFPACLVVSTSAADCLVKDLSLK